MSVSDDQISRLLADADAACARGRKHVRAADGIAANARRIARERHRGARRRLATATSFAILAGSTLLIRMDWNRHEIESIHALRLEADRLDRDASERANVIQMVTATLNEQPPIVPARPRNHVPNVDFEFADAREQAAAIELASVQQFAGNPSHLTLATARYRKLIDHFPETRAAKTAARQLAAIQSGT